MAASESANVVGSRHVQVETGLTWTRVNHEARIFDLPQALLRLGLGRSLELRLVAPDNTVLVALYTLERQPDGSWRITSCLLAPSTVRAA